LGNKKEDVDRINLYKAETIPRSRKMHQVQLLSHRDPTFLQIRELMCFCAACLAESYSGVEAG
jgi:hypothetical protein